MKFENTERIIMEMLMSIWDFLALIGIFVVMMITLGFAWGGVSRMSTLRQAAQAVVDRIADLGASPLDWPEHSELQAALAAPEYDQQALELCETCGWKTIVPGEPCLNCARDALTKERDSISACYEAREEEAHQLSERIIKLTKERDELMFQADIQVGSIYAVQAANQRLAAERDALMQAAKLALDVLEQLESCYTLEGRQRHRLAIAALKKAGV